MRLFVISPFPRRETPESGIAYYARTLASQLTSAGVGVVAVTQKDATTELKGVEVVPVWEHGVCYPVAIACAVRSRRGTLSLVHHAPFLYGNSLVSVFIFPLLLLMLRILGCRAVTELHDVRPIATIDSEFTREKGLPVPAVLVKLAYRALFFSIGKFSQRVIVHDDNAYRAAVEDYKISSRKITETPLVVPIAELVNRETARAHFNLSRSHFCFLFFGYASDYKGLDLLLEAMRRISAARAVSEIVLIVAAGPNPHLLSQPAYQAYYAGLKEAFERSPGVLWKGFVPDDDVALYFSAADAVVLPYTKTIGSSAPLTQALSYSCPVIVSRLIPIEGYEGDLIVCDPTSTDLERAMCEMVARHGNSLTGSRKPFLKRQGLIEGYLDALRTAAHSKSGSRR